jgi:hypothetical protein
VIKGVEKPTHIKKLNNIPHFVTGAQVASVEFAQRGFLLPAPLIPTNDTRRIFAKNLDPYFHMQQTSLDYFVEVSRQLSIGFVASGLRPGNYGFTTAMYSPGL